MQSVINIPRDLFEALLDINTEKLAHMIVLLSEANVIVKRNGGKC